MSYLPGDDAEVVSNKRLQSAMVKIWTGNGLQQIRIDRKAVKQMVSSLDGVSRTKRVVSLQSMSYFEKWRHKFADSANIHSVILILNLFWLLLFPLKSFLAIFILSRSRKSMSPIPFEAGLF